MKTTRTSPSLRSVFLFVCLLLLTSFLTFATADYFQAAANSSLRWPTVLTSRFPAAAALMQVGASCMNGLGFSYAQGFAPDPATGERPISVVSGDFNKDGKVDLVASNIFGNTLSVLPGDGTGTFGIATNIPVVSDSLGFPSGLATADFNGDGNLDLAVAIEFNPGRVFLMSGNGAGNFTFTASLDTGVNTHAVGFGDFNGDSKPDLVTVSSGDTTLMLPGTVSVFLNNGSGGFGTPTLLTPGTTPVALTIGDFSGDSQPDIVVVNAGSNNFSYYVNSSSGTFQAPVTRNTGLNPRGIVAGFFNGDTRLDLAVTNAGSDTISVYMNDTVGGFNTPANLAAGTTPSGIVSNDFNSDGKADLAFTNLLANQAAVMLNDGSGGFNAPLTTAVGADPLSLVSGDFNSDMKADLAVANSSSSNISILLGQDTGSFSRTTFLFSTPQAVVINDFNKDNRQDIAVANFGGDKVTIFLAAAGGGYSMPSEVGVGIKPASLVTGDFNKDTNLDLAVANNGSNDVSLLLGDGTGGFATHTTFTVGTQPRSLTVADFNNDSNLDLATANEGSNTVSFLRGQGDGTFQAALSFATGAKPVALDAKDLNADNIPDLAVANSDSTFVTILLSNGAGSFTAGTNVNLPGKGISLVAADVNKNGRADLIVGLAGSTQIAIALNSTGATFQTPTVVTSGGTTPIDVAVGDFDGDSNADLAVANNSSATISILRGNGNGTFESAKNFGVGVGPIALDFGDLNNDKRADLAVVNQLSNSMTLLLNTCANTPPNITPAAGLIRTQGGTGINATIATVSDAESSAGSLTVSALPSAGVTITNITNTNGTVSANVAVDCTTAVGNKAVTLQVVDGNGLPIQATLTINVTANTAPVLGNYTGLEIVNGTTRNFAPSAVPMDNGTVPTITAVSTTPGFTGTFSVNPTTGVLTVTNAAPNGVFDITLTATDNCGLTGTKTAQLKVVAPLVITTLDPASKQAQSGNFDLMVNGSGFTANSKVLWNGAERTTTFVSATKLTAAIPAADININGAGSANITVTDPGAGGITSNSVVLTITAPNPVPAITTLNPASAIAGNAGFTLTINGSNFVSGSVVKFNGVDRPTTFVSNTQLTIAVTAADIASPGSATIAVFTPAPGGGTSGTVNLPINNPAPGAITLSPASVIAGSAAITLTVNGAGFRPDSIIRVNGADRTTTVVSTTQLTTQLTTAELAAAGLLKITVNTPPPGGGLSPEATFTVNNPAPVLTSLDPSLVLAGAADFTLKINGTGFVNGSQVKVNGTDRATTFVNATQLTVPITAADVANTGTINITVVNAAPGGGVSNQLGLAVNNPVPTLTNLTPASASVGNAATAVTLTGTGYRPNSVVRVNGADRPTIYDSTTQLK
ncbi:MAG TPA: FG-GAP-like repeat-containing protein, partial [Blastocatellia bacterium]|nr:FG-GAP-like repeat-containing protein [Blastocatellia bacterium]